MRVIHNREICVAGAAHIRDSIRSVEQAWNKLKLRVIHHCSLKQTFGEETRVATNSAKVSVFIE